MKLKLSIIVLLVSFLSLQNLFGQTITISSPATTDVCNAKQYVYSATTSGLNPNKSYYANWIVGTGSYIEGTISGVKVTWGATTSSNIGSLKVELKDAATNNVVATSNEISFTIKSIKHIKAQIPMFGYGGGVLTLDPCTPGTLYLGTANIDVPGTGTFPEKVSDFKWLVPSGWTVQGQTSNGSTWISSGQNVTVTYPASATEGSISVKGYHVVSDCTSELQESLPMDAVTVKRDAGLTLSANKSYLLCGETNPVTFTVTPALPCAVYYWNNSQTPSTSNTFQITPDGTTDVIATVNIVYGGKTKTLSKTINYKLYDPANPPTISGPLNVCMNGSSYSITNFPVGATIEWNQSSNISLGSPQGSNPCTFVANGSGSAWIEATLNGCRTAVLPRITVGTVRPTGTWIQNGISHQLNTVNFVNYGSWVQTTVACPDASSFNWRLTGGTGINWNQSGGYVNYMNLYLNNSSSYGDFILDISTPGCGLISPTYHFVPGYSYGFAMSPNPATTELTISRIDKNLADENIMLKPKKEKFKDAGFKFGDKNQEEYSVELYSEKQGLLKSAKAKDESCKIDLRDLPSGTYFLHIENDYVLYREQIIIQK